MASELFTLRELACDETAAYAAVQSANSTSVPGVALDGAHVYWLNGKGDAILRSATAVAAGVETFATGSSMTALAIAAGEVF